MAIRDYIIYTHHDSNIQTIGQFLDNLGLSIVRGMTAEELLNYKTYPDGIKAVSNLDRILSQYNRGEMKNYNDNISGIDPKFTVILVGTKLAIPKSQLFNEVATIAGYDQTTPIRAIDNFLADNHKKLLSDPTYYPIDKVDMGAGAGVLNTQYPNMSVWVWCRALSPEDADYISPEKRKSIPDFTPGGESLSTAEYRRQLIKHFGIDGNLINITPFIISASTNIDSSGGSFQFQLAAIECESDKAYGWRPSKKTIDSINAGEFVAQSKINKYNKDSEAIERSSFLLHNVIQPNDLIFIRFETLEGESDRRDDTGDYEFIIDKSEIAGKAYDMIGLIDSNSIDSSSVDVAINVRGRDLMKLLIEDGSYFYPLAYTNYAESDYGDQKLLRRLSVTGKYPLYGQYAYRSIQYSVEFIINQVSNISVVPDNLFTSYGDRVSKTLQFDKANEENRKLAILAARESAEELIGISRINDGLALDDPTEERAKIVEAFNTMYRFIKDAKDQGGWLYNRTTFRVQTWAAGTYSQQEVGFAAYPVKWQGLIYDINAREITSSEVSFELSDASGVAIDDKQVLGDVNEFADDAVFSVFEYIRLKYDSTSNHEPLPMPGIWQIIKLAFDPQIDGLRIADPSIAQPDGGLIDQMRKFCQEPFVEFYGDTFGDLYYFISRIPPWNKSSIIRYTSDFYSGTGYFQPSEADLAANKLVNNEGAIVLDLDNTPRDGFVINIYEEDVVNDSLSFYDGEVYSFYEISPMAGFLGQGSEVSLGYIPIVQIPEYAEIFGSKRYKVITQYSRFDGTWRFRDFKKQHVIEQAALDLEWIVETNIYLPFTRQGRITINGDRRIKRGTWIRYNPTGELYYVVAVSQEYSINSSVERTTTIQVERGMVEAYIEGATVEDASGEEFIASYFSIADTIAIRSYVDQFSINIDKAGKIMQSFVDKRVLNFFLKRNQFKDNQIIAED